MKFKSDHAGICATQLRGAASQTTSPAALSCLLKRVSLMSLRSPVSIRSFILPQQRWGEAAKSNTNPSMALNHWSLGMVKKKNNEIFSVFSGNKHNEMSCAVKGTMNERIETSQTNLPFSNPFAQPGIPSASLDKLTVPWGQAAKSVSVADALMWSRCIWLADCSLNSS